MSLRKLFPITSLDDSVSSTPSDYATPSSIISRFKDWCGFAVNISRGIVVGLDTKECFVLPDSIVSDKKSSAQRRSFELEPYLPIAAESMVVASLRSASNNDRLILIADRDRIQSAIDRYEANGHWIGAISCTSFIALQHAVETSFLNRTCNVMWKRDDDSWEFFAIQDGVPTAWQWLNLDSIPNDIWFENPSEDIASIPMIVIGQIDHEMEEKLLEYFGHIDVRPSRAIEEFAEQSAHRILSGESTPWFDLRRKPVVTLESIAPLRWSLLTFCIVLWLALIASSAIVLLRSWVLAAQTDDHEKAQVALFQELFPQQSIPVDIPGRLRSELRQSNADREEFTKAPPMHSGLPTLVHFLNSIPDGPTFRIDLIQVKEQQILTVEGAVRSLDDAEKLADAIKTAGFEFKDPGNMRMADGFTIKLVNLKLSPSAIETVAKNNNPDAPDNKARN
jgi:hypothetical protein